MASQVQERGRTNDQLEQKTPGGLREDISAVGECGLWRLPDPGPRAGSASERCDLLPARVRVSERVGGLWGVLRVMPVKHLNTERGPVTAHTQASAPGAVVERCVVWERGGHWGRRGLREGSPGWCGGLSPEGLREKPMAAVAGTEQPCWRPEPEPSPQGGPRCLGTRKAAHGGSGCCPVCEGSGAHSSDERKKGW